MARWLRPSSNTTEASYTTWHQVVVSLDPIVETVGRGQGAIHPHHSRAMGGRMTRWPIPLPSTTESSYTTTEVARSFIVDCLVLESVSLASSNHR
jgi:hypothetical protein